MLKFEITALRMWHNARVDGDTWDWKAELAQRCGGMFNLDAFDWDGLNDFIIAAHRYPAARPSSAELRAELDRLRPLAPGWGASIVAAYAHGLDLLARFDRPVDEASALAEVERLLRDGDP